MAVTETLIADLAEDTIIADNDLVLTHDVTANRTKKTKYSTVKNQIASDLQLINQTTLNASIAAINAAITTAINTLKQNDIYAVGKLFISATDASNPAVILGFGTWTRVSRFIAGYDPADADFSPVGKTGGAKTHAHGGVTGGHALLASENGYHSHIYRDRYAMEEAVTVAAATNKSTAPFNYNAGAGTNGTDFDNNTFLHIDMATEFSGAGVPHTHPITTDSNLPPYEVFYIWKRVS